MAQANPPNDHLGVSPHDESGQTSAPVEQTPLTAQPFSQGISPRAGLKEEPKLFRYIALLAGCGLLAATVWIAQSTRAQEEFDLENPFADTESAEQGPAQPIRTVGATEADNPFATQQAPATDDQPAAASTASDVFRRRIDDRMRQARRAMRDGDKTEAVRLAQTAKALATQYQVTFAPGVQTPTQLLAQINSGKMNIAVATPEPPTDVPEDAEGKQQYAHLLMTAAQEHLADGNLEAARQKAMQAESVNATYGPLDMTPEQLLEVIASRQPADPQGPTNSFLASLAEEDSTSEPAQTPQPFPTGDSSPAQNAQSVLKMARAAIEKGHFDEARSLALDVQKMDTEYEVFDDKPEYVLAEIERLTGSKIITPASSTTPATELTPQQVVARREEAQGLLASAREALAAGDVDAARQSVNAARALDATYPLLADTPDLVAKEIATAEKSANVANSGTTGTPPLPTHTLAPNAAKQQAVSLLNEARSDLQNGHFDAAREKATAAAEFDVTYNLFEESPETILQDIDRAAPAGDAGASAPMRDNMIVNTSGSAQELYRQGIDFLRQGERQVAYDLFLQASNAGDDLSPQQRQQLQDMLRELAPRRGGIQQVAGEGLLSAPGTRVQPGMQTQTVQTESRLDAAVQKQSLQYDRARTEVMNAMFRAERLRDTDPKKAAEMLAATEAELEASDLSPQQLKPLLSSLKSSRESIDSYMAQRKPLLDMEQKNKEVRDKIESEMATGIRIDQEVAELTEQFNELMRERRFGEATTIAKKAEELAPENTAVLMMKFKSQFAYRNDRNNKLKDAKAESYLNQLDDVEWAAVSKVGDDHPMDFGDVQRWKDVIDIRQSTTDARARTPEELRIRESLTRKVSLHFTDAPLAQVIQDIATGANINAVIDQAGIQEEGLSQDTPITINVEGIMMQSALSLMLEPLGLDYTIEHEVLKITSRLRQQGEMVVNVYPVADLIVPIPTHAPSAQLSPMGGNYVPVGPLGGGQMSIAGIGGQQSPTGQAFHQVTEGSNPLLMGSLPGQQNNLNGPDSNYDFQGLTELITTTVNPDTWEEFAGQGSISRHTSTLSLVIRQTQRVHQEIADLLDQLRRLQDLQVTIEVRFITVSDRFFERIGIDFDFNINDDVGGPAVGNNFVPLGPFGGVDPINGQIGGVPAPNQQGQAGNQAGQQAGQQGQQGQQGQGAVQTVPPNAPFSTGPLLNLVGRDDYGDGVVVGMVDPGTFSSDLDIPFRQGSFELGIPEFGGFAPESGLRFGMAILSDIEAFLFVQAAQGDERSNLMFAPKITLFNGQIGSVQSVVARPFVISVIPVVSAFAVGFQPVIQNIQDGISMTVQAVISADRRYVRIAVAPFFNNITDVFTFSFVSGAQPTIGGGQGGGGGGQLGGGGGGGGQGFGGGGGGGQGFGGGGGGGGGIGGGQQGQGGQQQQGGTGGGSITVQQPVQEQVTVSTVVSVPDGGTVLLGGIKRLREGRSMNGVPILNKIPYVSRLFKNSGVGRETESLMLMVTPRIIIQEEEEELLTN